MPNTVELHLAYVFTCDSCGSDTFVYATPITHESLANRPEEEWHDPFTPEREAEDEFIEGLKEGFGNGEGTGQLAYCRPDWVKCKDCGEKFRVAD